MSSHWISLKVSGGIGQRKRWKRVHRQREKLDTWSKKNTTMYIKMFYRHTRVVSDNESGNVIPWFDEGEIICFINQRTLPYEGHFSTSDIKIFLCPLPFILWKCPTLASTISCGFHYYSLGWLLVVGQHFQQGWEGRHNSHRWWGLYI